MRLADLYLVLGSSVRRAFLAKSVRFTCYTCGVGDCTARSFCPLTRFAYLVRCYTSTAGECTPSWDNANKNNTPPSPPITTLHVTRERTRARDYTALVRRPGCFAIRRARERGADTAGEEAGFARHSARVRHSAGVLAVVGTL